MAAESDGQRRRVLVVEPQRLVRETLVAAVGAAPGLEAVDGSRNGTRVERDIDAAVVAAHSIGHGWSWLIAEASSDEGPSPLVLVADYGPVQPSVDPRGVVVVSRQTPLTAVIECLLAGAVCREGLPHWHEPGGSTGRLLSGRERQVLGLLATGLSPAQIARSLAITIYTVRDHIKSIRTKLDRPTTLAAVLEAIRMGLVPVNGG
ncbi:MAG: response regulator transcription factor [Acidimicrobiales bacterium]